MHCATSSGCSRLVRTVGTGAKTWWSWRRIVNDKSERHLHLTLKRLGGLSIVIPVGASRFKRSDQGYTNLNVCVCYHASSYISGLYVQSEARYSLL